MNHFALEGSVRHEFFIFPDQTGTATSSPTDKTSSQSINIVNVILWMKKNAYKESTIKKTAKILRHYPLILLTTLNEEVRGEIERIFLLAS